MEYHDENCYLAIYCDLPNELFWTSQETIDKKKTAEAFIVDESLDIISHYKLACIYCLEDDILALWNQMPENRSKLACIYCLEDDILALWNQMPENRRKSYCEVKVRQQELVVLWTYDIKGEVTRMDNAIER